MLAKNYVVTMNVRRSHWKNTTLAQWSERWGLALAGCGMSTVILTKNSPDKGNTRTFSSCSSSHTGSEIFFQSSQYTNFHTRNSNWLRPSMIDTHGAKDPDCSVASEVWGIICEMKFCIVDNFLFEGTCFLRISNGPAIHEMHVCHFPSRVIRFHYKTTKWISNWMSITTPTITTFSLVVHMQRIYWVYRDIHNTCKGRVSKHLWCALTS
jgi:hypothetical protein